MNNYQAAAQAGFPPASPHAAGGHGGPQGRSFPAANSPGPIDMYSSSAAAAAAAAAADSAVASYVQAAASPQPPTTAFPAIAVSRAPLNYSPVSQSRQLVFHHISFKLPFVVSLSFFRFLSRLYRIISDLSIWSKPHQILLYIYLRVLLIRMKIKSYMRLI